MDDKKALRKIMSERRKVAHGVVDPNPALEALEAVLRDLEGPVSFYWPIRTEIDPRPVMETMVGAKSVCLPMTHGYSALTFRPWQPGMAMIEDSFGVAVPDTEETLVPKTLVLPMLAFDDLGQRLGYGAGHYDRTLAMLRTSSPVTAIGFAYEAQRDDKVPTEATDQPLNMIVTETQVRRFEV